MSITDPIENEQALAEIISSFDPIGLKGLDAVRLMNRQDTKYVLLATQLPMLLESVNRDYFLLDINGDRHMAYDSLYFDTPGFDMYLQHHNTKLNRTKVRFRKYENTQTTYFEIKFKSNKGRTIKSRIPVADIQQHLDGDAAGLVRSKTTFAPSELLPQLQVHFRRLTLADKQFKERITLDTGLRLVHGEKTTTLQHIVIAEVKQNRFNTDSPLVQVMRREKISEMRLSKYCTGIALLVEDIKYNRFKPKIRYLNKLKYRDAI